MSKHDARRYLDRIFQFRLEILPFPKQDMRSFAISKFNEAVPGLANKIIDWAETEGNHRRLIETKSLDAEIKLNNRAFDERRLGQIFGFLIGTIAIVAGSVTAILGSPIAGTLIGGSGVVGLVSAFLYSKRKEERSSHAKNDDEQ